MKTWITPEIEVLTIQMTKDYYNQNHKDWCPACRNPEMWCYCGARSDKNNVGKIKLEVDPTPLANESSKS